MNEQESSRVTFPFPVAQVGELHKTQGQRCAVPSGVFTFDPRTAGIFAIAPKRFYVDIDMKLSLPYGTTI